MQKRDSHAVWGPGKSYGNTLSYNLFVKVMAVWTVRVLEWRIRIVRCIKRNVFKVTFYLIHFEYLDKKEIFVLAKFLSCRSFLALGDRPLRFLIVYSEKSSFINKPFVGNFCALHLVKLPEFRNLAIIDLF